METSNTLSTYYQKSSITFNLFTILTMSVSFMSFYSSLIGGPIYYLKYGLIILFIVYLMTNNNFRMNYKKLVLAIILMVFSLLHFLMIDEAFFLPSTMYILLTALVALSAVFMLENLSLSQYKTILNLILISAILTVILPSVYTLTQPSYYYSIGDRYRYIGIFNNPNELARFCLLAIAVSFNLIIFTKNKILITAYILLISISLYIIVQADSRAALLTSLLIILGFISIYFFLKVKGSLFFAVLGSISLLFLSVMASVFLIINGNLRSFDDLSSGRIEIWTGVLDQPANHLLFGLGQQGSHVMANGYIELIQYFGVLGFVVWASFILYLIVKKIKITSKYPNFKNIFSVFIIFSLMIYFIFEGGIITFANALSIYFWIELLKNNQKNNF